MKKRIIALLLSVSIFFFSFGLGNRRASAAATGTVVAIASIGTLAFSVLMLITSGEAEKIADDVYYWIEYTAKPGMEVAFTGDNSWLAQGYNKIFQTIRGWVNSGEVEIINEQAKLTYSQYLECYRQLISYAPKPGVDFQSDYLAYFLEVEGLPMNFPVGSLPTTSILFNEEVGESYALCYYNDEQIIFSDYYIFIRQYKSSTFFLQSVNSSFSGSWIGGFDSAGAPIWSDPDHTFTFGSLSSASASCSSNTYSTSNCFVFSNGRISYTPIAEVNLTGCKYGLVTTSGDYPGFLKSLTGYTAVNGSELDDLSVVLPTEYNPSLTFPVNPDLSRPLPDQIIVGDVPGVSDLPLSDYMENIKTDIEVPSIIASKFPFCIPFDFMRFLGLLCSDPVAPVFRIPISTNPDNLDAWKGNQTVGDYLYPDDPMFEIDEEIVIDLSVIPLVQPVCYTCFIVGFIILLLHITPKMIQH